MSRLNIQSGLAITDTVIQEIADSSAFENGATYVVSDLIRSSGILPDPVTGRVMDYSEASILNHDLEEDRWSVNLRVNQFRAIFADISTSQVRLHVVPFKESSAVSVGVDVLEGGDTMDVILAMVLATTSYEDLEFTLNADGTLVSNTTGDPGFVLRSGGDSVPQYIRLSNGDVQNNFPQLGADAYIVESHGLGNDGVYTIKMQSVDGDPLPIASERVRVSILGTLVSGDPQPLYTHSVVKPTLSVLQPGASAYRGTGWSIFASALTRINALHTRAFPVHHWRIKRNTTGSNPSIDIIESNDVRQFKAAAFYGTSQRVDGEFTDSKLEVYSDVLSPEEIVFSGMLDIDTITSMQSYELSTSLFNPSQFTTASGGNAYICAIARHEGEIVPNITNAEGDTEINPVLPAFSCLVRVEKLSGRMFRFSVEQSSFPASVKSDTSSYMIYLTKTPLTTENFIS